MFTRKTKIVATVGPAVQSKEWLEKLARAGTNVFRLNFSHGNHPDFSRIISDIREIEERLGEISATVVLCGTLYWSV